MKTILIVDKDPHLRELVRTTLEGPTCRIVEAADGEEGLATARQSKPDIILVDWVMPKRSGPELAMALSGEAPTIMLSAKCGEDQRAEALASGITVFLCKPFSPLELIDKIEAILGRVS